MFKVCESRNTYGKYYLIDTIINSTVVNTRKVQIKSFTTQYEEKEFIMLYNSKMEPVEVVIHFLNSSMENKSDNYIAQSVSALKFLYSYLEIFNIELESMSKKEASAFIDFIRGISQKGLIYTIELTTIRQNETINAYLKSIRKLVDFLGYENHIFLAKSSNFKTTIFPESMGAKTTEMYVINVIPKKRDDVPKYINVNDFRTICEIIDREYTLRDRIIVRLMFEHGLRIGEVLGLTLEDICYKEDKDFNIEYSIELRNRLSDTKEQHAKTAMAVITVNDYIDSNYTIEGVGYAKIIISSILAAELLEYINLAHNITYVKDERRYVECSGSDSVPGGNDNIKNNYYVFLNSLYRLLSANLWSKYLREIYKKAGIQVDRSIRRNNLSHRLRHGFIMCLANNYNLDEFSIKTLARHKQLTTTARYHNPTPEDVYDLQRRLINQWDISLLD